MLDIFRKDRGGGVLWVGTAKDEEEVRAIFQEASRCKPRSIFHLRPYYANEANNQAGRVRRGRSALTTKATPCRGPYVLLRPYGPQLVQGDRGWFGEDTLLGPRNKGSNLTHSSSYRGDPGEWCLRTRDCPTARRESCTAQKPDPVTLPFAFLRVESRVAIWFIPGCCELD